MAKALLGENCLFPDVIERVILLMTGFHYRM